MGILSMLRIFVRKDTTMIHKLMAISNLIGISYFFMMTATTTYLTMFQIIPMAFGKNPRWVAYGYGIMLYILLNVLGNFVNAYFADNGLRTVPDKKMKEIESELTIRCKRCDVKVPARVHHCVLCDRCIVKRDHHCFFMCGCIGYHNHKYFFLFCFYMIFGGLYTGILTLIYLNLLYSVKFTSVFSLVTLLPTTILNWWFEGTVNAHHMFLVAVFYGSIIAGISAAGFLYWQVAIIFSGQTTFEARRGIVEYNKSWKENFHDVFGPYPLISFLLPVRIPQPGYGIYREKNKSIKLTTAQKHRRKIAKSN